MFPCLARGNLRTSWVCAPVSRHSITCHRLSLPVPVPVALWPRRQQAALVYEDTCSNCSMLDLLNARFAQCSKPPKKCSKSPVPCKNSKFKNSKLRQSRNNSKFKTLITIHKFRKNLLTNSGKNRSQIQEKFTHKFRIFYIIVWKLEIIVLTLYSKSMRYGKI